MGKSGQFTLKFVGPRRYGHNVRHFAPLHDDCFFREVDGGTHVARHEHENIAPFDPLRRRMPQGKMLLAWRERFELRMSDHVGARISSIG